MQDCVIFSIFDHIYNYLCNATSIHTTILIILITFNLPGKSTEHQFSFTMMTKLSGSVVSVGLVQTFGMDTLNNRGYVFYLTAFLTALTEKSQWKTLAKHAGLNKA